MRLFLTFVMLFLFLESAYASDDMRLIQKPWHTSPSASPRSSTLYPAVTWDVAKQLKIGMTQKQAEKVIGASLQYYHHPINAILFVMEDKNLGEMEVALKRAADGSIEDISYRCLARPH